MKKDDIGALEAILDWRFTDRNLLEEALTHSSTRTRTSNERLEFLGDRVLGLVIAEAMVERHPDETEGQLAPRLNALVSRETCGEIANRIDLGPFLTMARSEAMSGGRRKAALLANAMEAVIAAVYLDGGLDAARGVILRQWRHLLNEQETAPIDAKTKLQEWAQGRGEPVPLYEMTARSGPDHAPVFTMRVTLTSGASAEASAASKRLAERACAEKLLADLAGMR